MGGLTKDDAPARTLEHMVVGLFLLDGEFIDADPDRHIFDQSRLDRICDVIPHLVRLLPEPGERQRVLSTAIERSGWAALAGLVVRDIHVWHEHREAAGGLSEDDWLLSSQALGDMRAVAARRILAALLDGTARGSRYLGTMLTILSDWGWEGELRTYANSLIGADEGLADYLLGFLNRGWSDNSRMWSINVGSVAKFVDTTNDELRRRCAAIESQRPDWLEPDRLRAVQVFLATMSRSNGDVLMGFTESELAGLVGAWDD